jgi:hypothetical protein
MTFLVWGKSKTQENIDDFNVNIYITNTKYLYVLYALYIYQHNKMHYI